tara:strand:+ start:741 stop:1343 length:603 start_codon:yes stop_codon:yes gene_type:complete
MIGIYSHNTGNVYSIVSALNKFTDKFKVTNNLLDLKNFNKIIIPGVGNMIELSKNENLKKNLIDFNDSKKIILGICLGAQYFLQKNSESNTSTSGLIKGNTKSLKEDFGIHLNVCFNKIEKDPNNEIAKKLFNNIWDEKFYFLHRYYMNSEDDDSQVLYSIKNKKKIPSVLIKNNIVGIQFHPELSFDAGVKFFKNFYSL